MAQLLLADMRRECRLRTARDEQLIEVKVRTSAISPMSRSSSCSWSATRSGWTTDRHPGIGQGHHGRPSSAAGVVKEVLVKLGDRVVWKASLLQGRGVGRRHSR